MSNQVELALNQIIGKIEPLTRFDRSSLKQERSLPRVITGKAFWRFTPSISNHRENHTNRLPYRATAFNSLEELDEAAQQTHKSAYDELPQRIQSWLRINEQTDRELEPSHCFDGPKIFGYEYRCSTCLGEGWVKCPKCKNGYNDCVPCKTIGHFDCKNCESFWGNVKGMVKCTSCNGKGKKDGQRCQNCQGKGKIECPKCHGRKIIECKPCGGRGKIPCSTCGTTDRVTCSPCDGTGYFHNLRTIECTVNPYWKVDLKDEKLEVVQQLVNRDLSSLRTLASVSQMPPTVQDNIVGREYNFECRITEIVLNIAGTKKEVIGYGDKAKIYDFKNIVSVLLNDDLVTLKRAVAETPPRLWGKPTKLFTATKQFLESEVNIDIDNSTFLTQKIIDKSYIEQVKHSVPDALKRLYAANIGLAFLVTALVPILLFLISYFTGLQEIIGYGVLVAPAIAAIISWILLERRTRDYLTVMFNDSKRKKVDELLKKYYILWKFRGLALVLTLVILIAMAVLPLP